MRYLQIQILDSFCLQFFPLIIVVIPRTSNANIVFQCLATCFEVRNRCLFKCSPFRASFYGFHFIGFPKRSTFVASFVDPSNGYRSRNSITQVAWHFLLAFNDFFIWLQIKDDRAFNMKWLSNTFKSGWPIDRQTYNGRAIGKQICHQGCTNRVLCKKKRFLCQIWYGIDTE